VGKASVRVDPKNIEAMQDWPFPNNLKILRIFLGLTGYYHKFVKNYGELVAPLTSLIKKKFLHLDSYNWSGLSNLEGEHVHHSSPDPS
jgi:hypothetical protein